MAPPRLVTGIVLPRHEPIVALYGKLTAARELQKLIADHAECASATLAGTWVIGENGAVTVEVPVLIATQSPTLAELEYPTLEALLVAVRDCRACEAHLPLGPRPVLRAATTAQILIVGQAPGLRVHKSGIPWNDPSGERLRGWMGVNKDVFYDESRIAIIPMGYCYPGRGSGGDLPPRRECAQLWLDKLLAKLPLIELTLLVGHHAQRHFLGSRRKPSLAETTKAWAEYSPAYVPLPHPSPRNTPWLQRNSGFERQLLPQLRKRIAAILRR